MPVIISNGRIGIDSDYFDLFERVSHFSALAELDVSEYVSEHGWALPVGSRHIHYKNWLEGSVPYMPSNPKRIVRSETMWIILTPQGDFWFYNFIPAIGDQDAFLHSFQVPKKGVFVFDSSSKMRSILTGILASGASPEELDDIMKQRSLNRGFTWYTKDYLMDLITEHMQEQEG